MYDLSPPPWVSVATEDASVVGDRVSGRNWWRCSWDVVNEA
ncbi:hypothetical protein MA3A0122S_2219 [Mycobacteroides abscessus 3A-0122-S]|nr:hypothetical protein MA3A0122S_2219 [Mycobacteroides abscessus 3A-0122-S]